MPSRRKAPISDRRKVDAEFRLHLVHRADSLETMVHGVEQRMGELEHSLRVNTTMTQEVITAVKRLSEETELSRQLIADGKGAARLVKLLWKPFIVMLAVGFSGNALWSYLINGSWPGWYKVLLALKEGVR